ncbi:hypothetical protein CXF85_19095 [Colwellia sp. 75C3]|uniref:hypothetical protein n=1 Tax=Colwellia sp. 75C3 TaxID=888425 RepID=UPI000C321407|nr:hypothetical protein [Colwellia sp. 75C3]PKG81564.1 hypothetical protein CXF85_19095 [Colwellia sp. 75C3]
MEDKTENLNLLDRQSPSKSAATSVEQQIIFSLDQYEIEVKRGSIKRMNHVLKTTSNACIANRAKLKERETYSYFSFPQSFYLTPKLYRFNQNTPLLPSLFNQQGELNSIKALFDSQPNDHIGLADGVSFGSYLDREIAQLKKSNIYYRGGTHRVFALESMLYAGRVDYLLSLPVDMTPSLIQEKKLEQFNIAGAPPFVIAHFSCSKTEFGKQVIKDINQHLLTTYSKDKFDEINGPWYSKKDRAEIQSYLQKHYLDNQIAFNK